MSRDRPRSNYRVSPTTRAAFNTCCSLSVIWSEKMRGGKGLGMGRGDGKSRKRGEKRKWGGEERGRDVREGEESKLPEQKCWLYDHGRSSASDVTFPCILDVQLSVR